MTDRILADTSDASAILGALERMVQRLDDIRTEQHEARGERQRFHEQNREDFARLTASLDANTAANTAVTGLLQKQLEQRTKTWMHLLEKGPGLLFAVLVAVVVIALVLSGKAGEAARFLVSP